MAGSRYTLIDPLKTQVIFAACATACAGAACFYDLRESRIPNRLTLPVLLAALLAHAGVGSWKGLGDAVAAAGLAGFAFLLFHLAGGMGAGDVKLMAASAAVIGLPGLGTLLLATGVAGGIFAICVSLFRGVLRQTVTNAFAIAAHHGSRGLTPHPELNLSSGQGIRLPFAVPIAVGCAVTLALEMVGR